MTEDEKKKQLDLARRIAIALQSGLEDAVNRGLTVKQSCHLMFNWNEKTFNEVIKNL